MQLVFSIVFFTYFRFHIVSLMHGNNSLVLNDLFVKFTVLLINKTFLNQRRIKRTINEG